MPNRPFAMQRASAEGGVGPLVGRFFASLSLG
jgi:hypothetical protein